MNIFWKGDREGRPYKDDEERFTWAGPYLCTGDPRGRPPVTIKEIL